MYSLRITWNKSQRDWNKEINGIEFLNSKKTSIQQPSNFGYILAHYMLCFLTLAFPRFMQACPNSSWEAGLGCNVLLQTCTDRMSLENTTTSLVWHVVWWLLVCCVWPLELWFIFFPKYILMSLIWKIYSLPLHPSTKSHSTLLRNGGVCLNILMLKKALNSGI